MNKHLQETPIFVIAIAGLGCLIFFLDNLRINLFNDRAVFHMLFGLSQLIILGTTLLFFRYYVIKVNKERSNVADKFNELDKLNRLLINVTPTGIVLINNDGIIEYVNKAAGNILGSTKTVGLNILEFDTVKKSNVFNGISNAIKGDYSEILGEHYTSFTTRSQKVLNFYISPVLDENTQDVSHIILFIHDITQENKLKEEIEKTYLSTIEALAELVDARDKYTGQHSKNVSKYVTEICNKLNLNEKMKRDIKVAANIHDLGKIGIPDKVLNKPGRLTDEEYDCIKQHPVIGSSIISKIIGFDNISLMVKHHHEKWDGTGYPSGLKNVEIPLGSQIIAIADTFDAITTDRVYRKNLGVEKAIQILFEAKGKQFNPELVDVFSEIIRLEKL
jgi:PAS domain S-box-containing protein